MERSFLSSDEIQRLITMRIVKPGGLRQILVPVQAEEADREMAEGGHSLRTVTGPDLGPVFVEGHVPHPMHFIFNPPVPLHEVQEDVGRGLFGEATRHAVRILVPQGVAVQIRRVPLNAKTLLHMRKPTRAPQLGTDPNPPTFNPSVALLEGFRLRGDNPTPSA